MTQWSQDNILVITAADKGKKDEKGGGTFAVLALLQDILSFNAKLKSAIEAQDIAQNKQKLMEFQKRIEEMYVSILDLAKAGVESIRQEGQEEQIDGSRPPVLQENTIEKIP